MIAKIGMIIFFGCWALDAYAKTELKWLINIGALITVIGLVFSIGR